MKCGGNSQMEKFKKYLWFTPLALDYYILILVGYLDEAMKDMVSQNVRQMLELVYTYSWFIIFVGMYIASLVVLIKSDEYDARSAAKVAVFVKTPQILPVLLMTVFSILCVIAPPIGIFISFALWIRLIITSITTSVVVLVACIRIAKAGNLSLGKAAVLCILCFLPILEYIVPFILLKASKTNRKPQMPGMYGQNIQMQNGATPYMNRQGIPMQYGPAPDMYGQNPPMQYGSAPDMYGQNAQMQYGPAPDMYGQNPPMQYGPAPNMYGQNPPMQYGPAPNTYGQNPPMQYGTVPNMYGQNPPMQYDSTTDMSGQNIVVREEPSQDMI